MNIYNSFMALLKIRLRYMFNYRYHGTILFCPILITII
jgi:hypothetical protein